MKRIASCLCLVPCDFCRVSVVFCLVSCAPCFVSGLIRCAVCFVARECSVACRVACALCMSGSRIHGADTNGPMNLKVELDV